MPSKFSDMQKESQNLAACMKNRRK